MKKRINIGLAALDFLHRVLTETGVVTKVEARRQHAVFQHMEAPLTDFRKRLNDVRKKYREKAKDPQGNEINNWIIPEEKRDIAEEELVAIHNEKVDVDFDIESFGTLNRAFDGLFERQAELKEKGESAGMSNETTMKLINEAASALETVTDVQ